MRLLDALEKRLGRYAIPHLTVILIAGQSLFYVMFMTGKLDRESTYLSAQYLMAGEWWRLLAFPFDPPRQSFIFALFAWYFFYVMGSTLEDYWGSFRYNVYLLIGCLLTLGVSFLTPSYPVNNAFIGGSVFLAFATLFPDYEVIIFFILPVRMKWLALLAWVGYAVQFLFGDWSTRLMVLTAIGNFFLFFHRDVRFGLKQGGRRLAKAAPAVKRERTMTHRCTVCGITDQSHPDMDFRYCPKCAGQRGYCKDHIFSHEHVTK